MDISDFKTNRSLQRVVLMAVVIVALLAASVTSVLGIMRAKQEYTMEQQMYEQSTQELTQLQQMAKDEEKSKAQLEEYQQMMPGEMSQDVLLSRLSKLSDESGVEVTTADFSPTEKVETGNKLPMSVALKGSYTSVMELLEHFSMDGQLIVVDQLTLNGDSAGKNQITATAQLSAYYQ